MPILRTEPNVTAIETIADILLPEQSNPELLIAPQWQWLRYGHVAVII